MTPSYYLTRRAATDLRSIYRYSLATWGEKTASNYLDNLYNIFDDIAQNPEIGNMRKHRAAPFLMYPSGRHFVIYDRMEEGVVIVSILHQARNIEPIIAELDSTFRTEIAAILNTISST